MISALEYMKDGKQKWISSQIDLIPGPEHSHPYKYLFSQLLLNFSDEKGMPDNMTKSEV